VNLVPVTVVVRDNHGRAIGTLKKEDFRLSDNGKPQFISRFAVEDPSKPLVIQKESHELDSSAPEEPAPTMQVATRFVAYLFDDVHILWEDLARARDAAAAQISASLTPTTRAAIYTTSGQTMQEFTGDQALLQNALTRLRPRPVLGPANAAHDCPAISYYMANLLLDRDDREAWQTAEAETLACAHLDPRTTPETVLRAMVQTAASQAKSAGEHETRLALDVLGKVVRRVSLMPGQRIVILASPGFLTPDAHQDVTDVIGRAIRANVVVNTLDARGLWTEPGYSAADATPGGGANVGTVKRRYAHAEATDQEDVLAEFASATGGTFVVNTNDLAGGFQRLASIPEYVYVLGYTPDVVKSDGKYHSIKVTLREPKGLTLQARRGYYAPRREVTAAAQAHQDIEDALFARDSMRDFPLDLHTQFFKANQTDAKLSVLARFDIRRLKYHMEEGRYRNELKVVAALFDPSGNYIAASEKVVDFHLHEETLQRKMTGGLTVKTSFDVKAGSYVVRLVARDSEGQMMAAETAAVEIP
jgi:VWFA-related protein